MAIIDDRTATRDYPKPNAANDLQDDVVRLAEALDGVDTDVAAIIIELATKSAIGHGHPMSAITGLIDALNGKSNNDHTHALDDLSDVSTSGATNGQYIKRVSGVWQPAVPAIGDTTGLQAALDGKVALKGASIVVPRSDIAGRPSAVAGEALFKYNTETASFEAWNGSTWGKVGGGAAISDTPPTPAVAGDLWWSSALGLLFVYFGDADSAQWVSTSPSLDTSAFLRAGLNLSDLASKSTARANLDVPQLSQNLGDLTDKPAARSNLGIAIELIETAAVGTGSTKEIVLPAGYKSFDLRLRGVAPVAAGVMMLQFSLDGTTWKQANGDYIYSHAYNYVGGGVAQYGSDDGPTYGYVIGAWNVGANTSASLHTLQIAPGDGTDFTTVLSQQGVFSSAWASSQGGGYMAYTGRPAKARLFNYGGNLAKGSYDLYGYR